MPCASCASGALATLSTLTLPTLHLHLASTQLPHSPHSAATPHTLQQHWLRLPVTVTGRPKRQPAGGTPKLLPPHCPYTAQRLLCSAHAAHAIPTQLPRQHTTSLVHAAASSLYTALTLQQQTTGLTPCLRVAEVESAGLGSRRQCPTGSCSTGRNSELHAAGSGPPPPPCRL